MLNEINNEILKKKNISKEIIIEQYKNLCKGSNFIKIIRPAKINDGIIEVTDSEDEFKINLEKVITIVKFIPASGAATRMFEFLIKHYKSFSDNSIDINEIEKKKLNIFYEGLLSKKFALAYDLEKILLKNNFIMEDLLKNKNFEIILKYLLFKEGLNYSNFPKGLVKFHKYKNQTICPFEQNVMTFEKSKQKKFEFHFTINKKYLNEIQMATQKNNNTFTEVEFSFQDESTDTISIDEENNIITNKNGNISFRPGGHGALIKNLNSIKSDLIYIRNIDNISNINSNITGNDNFDVLSRVLLYFQNTIFKHLVELKNDTIKEQQIERIKQFIIKKLNIRLKSEFNRLNINQKADFLIQMLNRPMRVCGMVKNEGEPGGGPFWVNKNGIESLQIVEKAQINLMRNDQIKALNNSTHFNPVDMVCGVKNFEGEKFNLLYYIDPDTFFITNKINQGTKAKVLEQPGLWNGAMAKWISVFVEIPKETFTPVKEVNDLLKTNHRVV